MNIEFPHYRQEKRNTCALACLRMVLAAYGTDVPESELQAQAVMERRGTPIGELERLTRRYGLVAEIQHVTVEQLRHVLAQGKLPITFVDRALFELTPADRRRHSLRAAKMHNVIPVRITGASVTLHDPRFPEPTKQTLRLFRQAYSALGSIAVVCSAPGETPGHG